MPKNLVFDVGSVVTPTPPAPPKNASGGTGAKNAKHRGRASHVQHFIDQNLEAAIAVKKKWRIPVAVTLCQSALESGWGKHVKGNAYFGVKGKSTAGKSVNFGTTEFIGGKKTSVSDTFRAYESFADAADGYGEFLNSNARYAKAFKHLNDPIAFAREIAKAGYATDPQYEQKLVGTINGQHLLDLEP